MGIRFLCEACGKKLNVKDNLAGKKGRCPKCNEKILIPVESSLENAVAGRTDAPIGESEKHNQSSQNRSAKSSSLSRDKKVTAHSSTAAGPSDSQSRPNSLDTKRNKTGPNSTSSHSPPSKTGSRVPDVPPIPNATPTPKAPSDEKQVPEVPPALNQEEPDSAASQIDSAFDEAPDASWFVRPVSGGQFGPADANTMKSWLSEGRIGRDSYVWREGWDDWENAEKVFELEFQGANAASEPSREPDPKSQSTSNLNIAYHRRARQKAKTMGIILIVALVLLTIALAVLLVLVANGTIGGAPNTEKESKAQFVLPERAEFANLTFNRQHPC